MRAQAQRLARGRNRVRRLAPTAVVDTTTVRGWLARELHDRVAQTLTLMVVDIETYKRDRVGSSDELERLEHLQASTRRALRGIREVLGELRDDQDDQRNLLDPLRGLIADFEARSRIGVRLTVAPSWPAELPAVTAVNLYRVVEEALHNVLIHSGARHVEVRLGGDGGALTVSIEDDGRGMRWLDPRWGMGMGILGMRERASLFGGRLEIDGRPGEGTTVLVTFPMELS
jgi:two-component system sensor histidine kinase UhpB